MAEEYVIASARLFIVIIKLTGYEFAERESGKLGHAITFPQCGKKLEEEIRRGKLKRHEGSYPKLDGLYDTLSIAFVGSRLQWAALEPQKSHQMFKPIQVHSEAIFMWLKALKAFNSRYADISIDDSEDMSVKLEHIPKELIKNAAIVDHESEIMIDKLVREESGTCASNKNGKVTNSGTVDQLSYPMSFLTKSAAPEITNLSASASALGGNILSVHKKFIDCFS